MSILSTDSYDRRNVKCITPPLDPPKANPFLAILQHRYNNKESKHNQLLYRSQPSDAREQLACFRFRDDDVRHDSTTHLRSTFWKQARSMNSWIGLDSDLENTWELFSIAFIVFRAIKRCSTFWNRLMCLGKHNFLRLKVFNIWKPF